MEKPQPTKEHAWLQRLAGEWTFAGTCMTGPDGESVTSTGSQHTRPIGELWIIGEMTGEMPGTDGTSTSLITLGFDPEKGKIVGTFVASMMTFMWEYEGSLEGDVLTLKAEGPSFTGDGMATYQDIIEITGGASYTMSSQVLGEDGAWTKFMTITFTRTA